MLRLLARAVCLKTLSCASDRSNFLVQENHMISQKAYSTDSFPAGMVLNAILCALFEWFRVAPHVASRGTNSIPIIGGLFT